VQHHVGTQGQGRLEDRGRERVVDEDQGARGVGGLDAGRQVGYLQQRVGRRLEPEQEGAAAGRRDRGGVVGVDDAQVDATDGRQLAEPHRHAGVGGAGGDDHGAHGHEVHHRVGRAHARREGDRGAVLERPEG
jgi:hypothetical protein